MIDEAKVMAYTSLVYSYEVGFYIRCASMLTNNTNYSFHIAKNYGICLTNHMRLIDSTYITQHNITIVYSH